MSGSELRPVARELVDSARLAQTPSDAHRERAYQSLLAGLSGAAGANGIGAGKVAKLAGKSGFAWLKWALPTAVLASASWGVYVEHQRSPAPAVLMTAVAPTPPLAAAASSSPGAPAFVPTAATAVAAQASAVSLASPAPAAKAPSSAKPATGDLGQELALLHRALAESRAGNAAGALALAQQHARQYPNSKLRVERDAIEVRSLCTLGRSAEAHRLADRLRTQAPGSPVSAALEETCVGK
jgi:hypothetical protein